jgi:transposase-like protein
MMLNATRQYAFRRWPQGVSCPKCECHEVIKRGKDETQPDRQRYQCKGCSFHFDDLSDTIFAPSSSASTGLDFVFVLHGIEQ